VQAGEDEAPARQAAIKGGLPPTVGAVTINKVCGSGLKAVMLASSAIKAGTPIVCGGRHGSMSQAPYLVKGIREGTAMAIWSCWTPMWSMACSAPLSAG
jgi:acetyl-CoA C-acetyltransferase